MKQVLAKTTGAELTPTQGKAYDIEMYTVKDIQAIMRISPTQAYALVNTHGFPRIRIGGKILVEKAALEQWLYRYRGKDVLI